MEDMRAARLWTLSFSLWLAATLVWTPARAGAAGTATGCRFVLGFAALHAALPGIVGSCLENEQHNPQSGDGFQHTTQGLLVWRKADNIAAFTDGYRTWVAGPYGLQERFNTQRFPWEPNPTRLPIVVPVTPTPASIQRCHTNGLLVSQQYGQVAVGNVGVSFRLRSIASQPCTLYGFPGVQLLDAAFQPLPTYLTWSRTGYLIGNVPEQTLTLRHGDSAYFVLEFSDVPGPGQSCPPVAYLSITPPNAFNSVTGPVHGIAPCGGRLTASPVLPSDPLAPDR